jgi:hypothetical protein
MPKARIDSKNFLGAFFRRQIEWLLQVDKNQAHTPTEHPTKPTACRIDPGIEQDNDVLPRILLLNCFWLTTVSLLPVGVRPLPRLAQVEHYVVHEFFLP